MAFSLRKMLSNMNYFKKLDDEGQDNQNENTIKKRRHTSSENSLEPSSTDFEHLEIEADSTSFSIDQEKPEITTEVPLKPKTEREVHEIASKPKKVHRNKKLKLDVVQSSNNDLETLSKDIGEPNTPKVVSLGLSTREMFSERLKQIDMSKSFDLFDVISDELPFDDVDAVSINTDSDTSVCSENIDKSMIKMCRKVDSFDDEIAIENALVRSTTPESFAELEPERNDDERLAIIETYHDKIEKLDYVLKNILTEFQFHVEVSKIFNKKAIVPSKSENLLLLAQLDTENRMESPIDWDLVTDQEDFASKEKLKSQLTAIKEYIDKFLTVHLKSESKKGLKSNLPSLMSGEDNKKKLRVSKKKKYRRVNDFPDFNEALRKLFCLDMSDIDCHSDSPNCVCDCHHSTLNEDTTKDDSNYSIFSSIGNFTLDSATLTVYSDTLDNIIDLSSFEDSNLYSNIVSKRSIERLTFYIQVHCIKIEADGEIDGKTPLKFHCFTCAFDAEDEMDILKHVLEQKHCEKIHFQYKSAYIKKCLSSGKEIQPSTVLNSMTFYRDFNKIVCFGDAMYACSLCFDSLIVGESVLMAHCSGPNHIEKRGMLKDFLD